MIAITSPVWGFLAAAAVAYATELAGENVLRVISFALIAYGVVAFAQSFRV